METGQVIDKLFSKAFCANLKFNAGSVKTCKSIPSMNMPLKTVCNRSTFSLVKQGSAEALEVVAPRTCDVGTRGLLSVIAVTL